jgi:hypothetical protein
MMVPENDTHLVEVSTNDEVSYVQFCEKMKGKPLPAAFRAKLALTVGTDLVTYEQDGLLYGYRPGDDGACVLGTYGPE